MSSQAWLIPLVVIEIAAVTAAQADPPPTPTSCTAKATSCSDYEYAWEAAAGATSYVVFRDGGTVPIATVPAGPITGITDHPDPASAHTYCVVAVNADGASAPCCATGTFVSGTLQVEGRHWFQDAFTSNETILATTFAAYDTTSAWVRTGLNLAQLTGTTSRQDLPGDTLVCDASGSASRIDLVFRILPGVGNYVTIGNRLSGLRRVPTSPTAAVANAASTNFWESYLADNGAVGTGGNGVSGPGHPSGSWDPNVWNTARCDTAESNIFPVEARLTNMPGLVAGRYASMYHEADPKYLTLGIPRNRCFLTNPAGVINSSNITCGPGGGAYPPPWALNPGTGLSASEGGLGLGVTREYTQIIPDGQLTPGSHVEYFVRSCVNGVPLTPLALNPDTNFVSPQSGCRFDCGRWAQFGVLPDRWKDPAFGVGGIGMAAMLVVDMDDGSGEECAWVSIADSIGLTAPIKRGAHNGWRGSAPGADLNDPVNFVRAHGGQAGTCWDFYSVRGSRDTLTGNAGSLGGRFAPRCGACPSSGRESRQGPTSELLRLYRMAVVLTGRRQAQILGPVVDRGQDDVGMLQGFAVLPGGSAQPRGLWFMGAGFAESENDGHPAFLANVLKATLRHGDYSVLSGNSSSSVPITTVPPPSVSQYGVLPRSLDVLNVQVVAPSGFAQAFYENVGAAPPYVASVFKPASGGASPYFSLLDGYALQDLGAVGNGSTAPRRQYVANLLSNQFGSVIFCPMGGIGVPISVGEKEEFLSLTRNPLIGASASIQLVLERTDRTKVAIYDVAGRLMKTLVDERLEAGPHEIAWDGTDSAGRRVSAGVYLVRASTGSGLRAARSIVVLR